MWKILALLLGVTLLHLKVISVQAEKIPKLEDVYWGPNEEPAKLDTSIRPFKVTFSNRVSSYLLKLFIFNKFHIANKTIMKQKYFLRL